MPKYTVLGMRPETPAESARREFFARQALHTPENLEAAARLLTGLVTSLLGVQFSVLALSANPLPGFLKLQAVQVAGIVSVSLLLLALLAALVALLPLPWETSSHLPEQQEQEFNRIVRRKALALFVAVLGFAAGVLALGGALIIALAAGG